MNNELNHWYAICSTSKLNNEITKKPLKLKLFDKNITIWKGTDNKLIAIDDRCPHRGASLSLGKIKKDCIICPFHGIQFDTNGICKNIPSYTKEKNTPKTKANFNAKTYKVVKKYDLVWIWWGPNINNYPEVPFINELKNKNFSYSEFTDTWDTNFTRAVENQLDISHLAFVHKNTIGKKLSPISQAEVIEIKKKNIHSIKAYNKASKNNGKNFVEFIFPNIWRLKIHEKIHLFIAFIPISENRTKIVLRFYNNITKFSLLNKLISKISTISGMRILKEDKKIVESQLPKNSLDIEKDILYQADKPIVLYRKTLERYKSFIR